MADAPEQSGDRVFWDTENERMIIDAPDAKVYVGKTTKSYSFSNGITISGFNTPWIAFAMVSQDGKPLLGEGATKNILLSAVFDAKNTNFDFDFSVAGGPTNQAKAVKDTGHAPILVDKVSCTVSFPQELQGTIQSYDFARRMTGQHPLNSHVIRMTEQNDWLQVASITSRGSTTTITKIDPSPGVTPEAELPKVIAAEKRNPQFTSIWHPLQGVEWGDNYFMAHKTIRDSDAVFTSISKFSNQDDPNKTFSVTGYDNCYVNSTANVSLDFDNDQMTQVSLEFVNAPGFQDLIAICSAQFGQPEKRHLVEDAFEESQVTWKQSSSAGTLHIKATEVQGVIRMQFRLDLATLD